MKSSSKKKSKFIIIFILFQLLSILATSFMLIAKIFVDIDWFYILLPIIISFGLPTILILTLMCISLIVILIFGKSKGINDIRKVVKNKKDE